MCGVQPIYIEYKDKIYMFEVDWDNGFDTYMDKGPIAVADEELDWIEDPEYDGDGDNIWPADTDLVKIIRSTCFWFKESHMYDVTDDELRKIIQI